MYLQNVSLSFTIFAASIILLFSLFLIYATRRHLISKKCPSVSVRFFSILGNFDDVQRHLKQSPSFMHAIYSFVKDSIKQLKEHPLCCCWAAFTPVIVIFKASSFEELVTNKRTQKKTFTYDFLHAWLGTGLLTSEGFKWKSRRKLLTPTFHFDILKEYLPVFNQQSQKFVKVLQNDIDKDYTDIVMPVKLCALDIICETTLGVDIGAQENKDSKYVAAVLRASHIIGERMFKIWYWPEYYFWLTPSGRQLKADLNLLHNFTRSVIQEKKRKPWSNISSTGEESKRKAFLELLLEHHLETKDLTEEDIREEVDTFTFEGHDTTSMGICWALYLIGLHKDIQEKLHLEMDRIFGDDRDRPVTKDDLNEMEYLENVLKETLRLYPPVAVIGREAEDNITISGYEFPKGTLIAISPYFIHRDEDIFPDPERFDPDRFLPENSVNRHPFAYAPFSAGQRNCIGQRFAIMEEKVVVSTILRNFNFESLDSRDEVLFTPELVLRPVGPIRMKFKSRIRQYREIN